MALKEEIKAMLEKSTPQQVVEQICMRKIGMPACCASMGDELLALAELAKKADAGIKKLVFPFSEIHFALTGPTEMVFKINRAPLYGPPFSELTINW